MLVGWSTLSDRWASAVAAAGDRTFLEHAPTGGEVAAWTYREFDAVVDRVRRVLAARGLRSGDRVHVVLPNGPAFVALLLAAARSGWVVAPCDPRSTAGELARQAARVRPALAVCGPAQAGAYRESGAAGPVVVVDPADPALAGAGAPGGPAAPSTVEPLTTLSLMFTSGTTSEPKIAEVTQANYAFAGDVMAAAAGLRPGSRSLVVLPLFHANAQYYSIAASISVGATVVLVDGFSASRFLEQAERLGATHASLFAAPVRMILARGGSTPLSRPLENVWFAQNLTDDEYERFAALVGCRPRQIYGMTETAPAVLVSRRLNRVPTSLGTTTPGCHVRLRDPGSGGAVAPGATGAIQVGGLPGLSLFAGYRDDPVATAAAFAERGDDGVTWLDTGDLARLDGAGEVEFVGRAGDMLKVAGENVSVLEVEAVLVDHRHVVDAAVVGAPDPVRDEVPIAFVVPAAGAPPALVADLLAWCEERLSGPRRPREIHLVERLPRTAVGKIQRFRLAGQRERGEGRASGR
ncbi:AMP-binding protein [Pseudonocardia broussonetiae]|uniref:AMP-binding protein n=1 Tax=Pseudonocardia broussonetiae TaxID=2736640 RepID=A0A6M6JVK8_9PSEU|nr:AMP-binding protein [Pseudonocardia broussonetiae]